MSGSTLHGSWLLRVLLPVCILAGCVTSPVVPPPGPAAPPRYEVVLKPRLDESGKVTAIGVESVIYGSLEPGSDRLSLAAPVVYAGAYGIADRVQGLIVTDQKGEVALETKDDPEAPGGFPYFRHWTVGRAVTFPVRIAYRTEVEQPTDRRGPPFNIRPSAGGVSGAGSGFLVIPENTDAGFSRVRWNLEEFSRYSSGISSWGTGEFELAGPPAMLMQGWYMAGPVGRYPAIGDADGFSAAWLGDFPFDPAAEMERTAEIYAWVGKFFEYLSPPPRYRVFMRIIDSKQTRFSGTALSGSFMLSGGPDSGQETNGAAPHGTFIHEMIHMWVGGVEAPQGVSSWFSEGLTSYYSLVLPLRGGFETLEEYAASIDRLSERYYTSPAISMSAEDIAAVGFGDEAIRSTPYSRGTMYFADLDARIRAASDAERSLDDLARDIFYKRQDEPAYTFDHDAWMAAISTELGPELGNEFQRRILDGEPIVPVSDAFGPCFERQTTTYTKDDRKSPGYAWVRKPAVPDDQCSH